MSEVIRGPREGWLSLLLLAVVVLTPAISLADAGWVDDLDIVPRLAVFALLLGVVLAKLRVRARIAHLFVLEFGLVLVGFYFAAEMPGSTWLERFGWLRERIWAWGEAAFGGGMSNDSMLFALLMALLAWFLGYASAWLVFKKHNAWLALVASGGALLVNLSYSDSNAISFFLVFMLASMLLLTRLTLYQRERDWSGSDAEYNRSLTLGFLWKSALLSSGIIALAWLMPLGTVNASVADNWTQITGPWQGLQGEFDRMFASVGASTAKTEGNRFTRTLALKGAIELGPDLVMQVSSSRAEYWGTQVYDKYTGQGWMSSAPVTVRLDANDNRLADTNQYKGRVDVEQRFRMLAGRSTSLFAATSPVKLSLPVNADQLGTLDDVAALKSVIPMRVGQQYSVISSVSTASAEELRKAGTEYPEWVKRYLQLPDGGNSRNMASSPRRVQQMARRLVAGTTNSYDAAESIEKFVRGFKYETKVSSPPPDRDAVDWFLFTSKQGYCDYFASAMAVMARSVGIPSRIVTGYNTGTFNEASGFFDVRQENAHSWPELFFPSYGWVRFEPTPSQPASSRPETPSVALTPGPTDPMDQVNLEALDLEKQGRDKMLLDDLDLTQPSANSDGLFGIDWTQQTPLLATLGAIALLLALAALVWRLATFRLSPAARAYLQTYAVAGLLGWRLRPSHTPVEYGRVLSTASPDLESDLKRVVGSYVEETYGGRTTRSTAVQESLARIRSRLPLVLLKRRLRR